MSSLATSLIVFACIFGGAILGLFLNPRLPKDHLNEDSKRVLTLASGVIATMAALVLGLLVASAKGNYDAQKNELLQGSAKIVLIERLLIRYGPEANPARQKLRAALARALDRLWPESSFANYESERRTPDPTELVDEIENLTPANDTQRLLKSQISSLAIDLSQSRFLMQAQEADSVSLPLLAMVVFWMSINFVSFGLFAPRNATVIVAFLLCAFAVAGAIFLILEMYRPLSGWMHVPNTQLHGVLNQLGK